MRTRKREWLDGTFRLAEEMGVTPCHVWMVRTGRRAGSRRVREAMEAAGVRLPKRTRGGAGRGGAAPASEVKRTGKRKEGEE